MGVYALENTRPQFCTHDDTACAFIPKDAVAFGNAHFGAGTGTIFVDEVGCSGHETSLTDCSESSTVNCSRGHLQDAGVRCQGLKKRMQ